MCGAMISNSQIKEQLVLYLEKRIPLAKFEDWFIPNTRDIHASHSQAAMATAIAVEGNLSEYLSGILNEEELHKELYAVVHQDTQNIAVTVDGPISQMPAPQFAASSRAITLVALSSAEFELVPAHQIPPQTNTIRTLQLQA